MWNTLHFIFGWKWIGFCQSSYIIVLFNNLIRSKHLRRFRVSFQSHPWRFLFLLRVKFVPPMSLFKNLIFFFGLEHSLTIASFVISVYSKPNDVKYTKMNSSLVETNLFVMNTCLVIQIVSFHYLVFKSIL